MKQKCFSKFKHEANEIVETFFTLFSTDEKNPNFLGLEKRKLLRFCYFAKN